MEDVKAGRSFICVLRDAYARPTVSYIVRARIMLARKAVYLDLISKNIT